jgi:hypothetical protein
VTLIPNYGTPGREGETLGLQRLETMPTCTNAS